MSITSAPPPQAPTTPAPPTATPYEAERIAYTSMDKGKPSLWTMSTDGKDRLRLTAGGTGSWFPLWSPNGKSLAFLSDMSDGNMNLFVHEKGGKGVRQLTQFQDMTLPKSGSLKPPFSWSPKSDEIAFIYRTQIWKVHVGSGVSRTLAQVDPLYLPEALEWAPHRENKYLAFLTKRGELFYALTLVNPRLLDQIHLAEVNSALRDISWSPDARRVAYLSDKASVFTASPETSIPKMITSNACYEMAPYLAYSPVEGTPKLLLLAREEKGEGFRVALLEKDSTSPTDTGTLKYLTEPGVESATWSPDASKIAFTSSGELWVMEANGTNKRRLAATGILSPSWSKK
jgi:Tol biopolymer transport system component